MVFADVRLLTGTYRIDRKGTTIHLYGKTKDGKSVLVVYDMFKPYFYLVEPSAPAITAIINDGRVIKNDCKTVELFIDGTYRRCLKVVTRAPSDVADLRKQFSSYTALSADIPFVLRFIYDFDVGACVRVVGSALPPTQGMDIAIRAISFEKIESFHAPLKILSFDIETSIKTNEVLCIAGCVAEGDEPLIEAVFSERNEADTIVAFERWVREMNPDIITGYNIDNFDLPRLDSVMKKSVARRGLKLGRDGSDARPKNRSWACTGRIIADAWWNVHRMWHPRRETLSFIAKEYLKDEKHDVDPKKMDEEWARDRERVKAYCLQDARLAAKALTACGALRHYQDLATVSRIPLEESINGYPSIFVDSLLVRMASKENVGVPMKKRGDDREKIKGAYVHEIQPGLYRNVLSLDFKSMYPSVMIAYNLCFTTKSNEGVQPSQEVDARFVSRDIREGIVPRCLKDMLIYRKDVRDKMRTATTNEEKEYLDGLQYAIKVCMNSVYGTFVSPYYRFSDRQIGETITAVARERIKSVIDRLEKDGYKVIVSDTDSVYVQAPVSEKEAIISLGNALARRFSEETIQLDFENAYSKLFSHGAKKRYIAQTLYPVEGEVVVRGYETRRTDAFDYQREVLDEIFRSVLNGDENTTRDIALERIRSLREGKVPADDLVISRSVGETDDYVNENLPNVRVMEKMKERGYTFIPGMKVSWIVTNGKTTPQECEPFLFSEDFKYTPDYEYYADRLIKTVGRVTEVFGIDEEALYANTAPFQNSLDRWV